MATIPDSYLELFEKKTFAHVVTLFPDGTPQVTPTWIDYDEETDHVLVNTERHRQKTKNVERNPTIAVSMLDPEDPYRYLSITGEVEEITTDGAREHIDLLSHRYFGREYTTEIQSERVLFRIRPERVMPRD